MAYKIRPAMPLDLLSIAAGRRRQRVLRLNPPYALVQPDSLWPDLLKSQAPVKSIGAFLYVYVEHGTVQGYLQAQQTRNRPDEWTIIMLGTTERAGTQIWGALLEEACKAAGEAGATRVYVKIAADEPRIQLFRQLGFTHYTSERIWGNLYFAPSADKMEVPRKPLRRQSSSDAWDLMQLYSAVTPPAVQRAEQLTSKQWQVSDIPRPRFFFRGLFARAYVWPNETGDHGLGGYVRLLTGARAHWITLLCRHDHANREVCPVALDYVLWKAEQVGTRPVYCGIREYQAELESLVEARGFHLLSEQASLVKYLATPVKERRGALASFLVPRRADMVATKFSSR